MLKVRLIFLQFTAS